MPKYCKDCGAENDDNSTFCKSCGKKLSEIHEINSDNKVIGGNNQKILIGVIVALLIVIAIVGTYAFVSLNNNDNNSDISNNGGSSVDGVSNSYVSDSSNVNTKTWHKIDSFNGVGDYIVTINGGGNRMKVVPSAMPIKNYADNFMYTTVSKNGNTIGSSQLSWNSKSAVATKSDTIEFSGSGTYRVYISAYELQYWNLEVYEYY
ncbi:MAG: zinc ribbon domain-containing protein [Methanobrevibacter sp.]|nr:zinc ribbon domain-containing protein [Methanobrevibacter sp.]